MTTTKSDKKHSDTTHIQNRSTDQNLSVGGTVLSDRPHEFLTIFPKHHDLSSLNFIRGTSI